MSFTFGIAAVVAIGASFMAYTLARYSDSAALDAETRQRVRRRALVWFLVGGVALAMLVRLFR